LLVKINHLNYIRFVKEKGNGFKREKKLPFIIIVIFLIFFFFRLTFTLGFCFGFLDYFFFSVKKLRFFGSSFAAWAGIVWARDVPALSAAAEVEVCSLLTQPFISSSSLAWNKYSPPFDNLKKKYKKKNANKLSFLYVIQQINDQLLETKDVSFFSVVCCYFRNCSAYVHRNLIAIMSLGWSSGWFLIL